MGRIVAARGPLLWLGPHRTLETAEWLLLFGAVGQGRAHAGWLHPFTVRRRHGFGGQKVGMTADRRLRQEVAVVFEHEAFAPVHDRIGSRCRTTRAPFAETCSTNSANTTGDGAPSPDRSLRARITRCRTPNSSPICASAPPSISTATPPSSVCSLSRSPASLMNTS